MFADCMNHFTRPKRDNHVSSPFWVALRCGVPKACCFRMPCATVDFERSHDRSKKVSSKKQIIFKPINGKLPPVQIPWDKSVSAPDLFDLHLVEVLEWREATKPRGKYVQPLSMKLRDTDAEILEVVKWSLNLSDSHCADTALDSLPFRSEVEESSRHAFSGKLPYSIQAFLQQCSFHSQMMVQFDSRP